MKFTDSKTKKRTLFGEESVYESKRSKQKEWMYGDGVSWFRGAMIGKGSFGCVFSASLKNSKSRYSLYPPIMAVKSAGVSDSGSLQKEKEVLDNINGCPYVITCFGEEITTGENGQMVYNLLLEYGSGGTLADVIKNSHGKGLPELDVRWYTRTILRGLSHVHKLGYVHCDLKPQNVLLVANEWSVGGQFVAKIADFGSAKRVKQIRKNRNGYSYGSCWRGTPMYLSPEAVINGVQEQPADIWAVGCIVFEMLTGIPLWCLNQDLSIDEILSVSSSVSAEGKSFLKKCLCRKVMCRWNANMLLKHPFLQGLVDDDDYIHESHKFSDLNIVESSSSCSDDYEDDDSDDDRLSCGIC